MAEQHFYSLYQRYARFYNLYFGKFLNPGRMKAIEVAELKPGQRVLEVGVGTGLSLPFYPPETEVTGIDLSPQMLKRAEELVKDEGLKNIKSLQVMNAQDMKFEDNSFECVMAMHVSTVVGDPAKFVQEMQRVCVPGGKIIIVSYFHDPKTPVGKVSHMLAPFAKYIGFRPDMTMEEFLELTHLKIDQEYSVNLLNIHSVLVCHNEKKAKH